MPNRTGRPIAASAAVATALLLILGCSSVPEISNPLPESPSQPFVPAAGQAPLQIVVNVLSGPLPSEGGSASVQRMDSTDAVRCGVTPCAVAISYQGTAGYVGQVSLAVGAYEVTYQPPSGYRLADNVVNPQTVTVPNPPPARMLLTFAVTP